MFPRVALSLVLVLANACRTAGAVDGPGGEEARAEVGRVLDTLHRAAAEADAERYFACFAPDAVFLGTDASERWDLEAFRAWAAPHFAAGRGWTYLPRDRHVALGCDGRLAWFDERLEHARYGELRGTGVLRRDGEAWRVVQYDLGFVVPNEATAEVVERIRAVSAPAPSPP